MLFDLYVVADLTTLRWILGKQGLEMWIGFIGLRIGTGGGLL
jgi:hypothetical protein